MAGVQPFRGIRYNLQRVGDLSTVICPPFDVVSDEQFYYQSSPYNMIRLEFGEERPGETADDNRYVTAARVMRSWLEEGILVRDERPALYVIEHRFPYQGSLKSRWGLIARLRLEELGTGHIRPHEKTMKKPARDRLSLLRSCRANFSPIIGLFHDTEGEVVSLLSNLPSEQADLVAQDNYGVTYSVWAVTDRGVITKVSDLFADRVIYIADGHHRYETALTYQKEQVTAARCSTGEEPFNFVMASLIRAEDPNLVMVPTHRLVRGVRRAKLAELERSLAVHFDMEVLAPLSDLPDTLNSWMKALGRRGRGTFGLYGLDGKGFRLLTARREQALRRSVEANEPPSWKELDVSLLHWVILRGMLGIDTLEKEERRLEYTRDGFQALSEVDSDNYQLAFFLNSAHISQILEVADAGSRVPQKSTYFHPKTPAGLVINPLWDD